MYQTELSKIGYTLINKIYTQDEVNTIIDLIESADDASATFRKTENLFAIRQFLKEVPSVKEYVFNEKLLSVIRTILGHDYFVVKSIYFDKPKASNWYVVYYRDLTM
jgi:hypothetical protein